MKTETAALVVAAVSLAVASLSLGWQIAEWLLSAGRPKAILLHGIVDGPAVYCGPVPKDGQPIDLQALRQQGVGGAEVIGIRVTNHGRAPVMVERVTVHAEGGRLALTPFANRTGPDLPHRLEPGTNSSWYLPAGDAVRLATSSRDVLKDPVTSIYMTAELGTGKTVRTQQRLRA